MPPITLKAASGKALADTEIHLDRDFDGKGWHRYQYTGLPVT